MNLCKRINKLKKDFPNDADLGREVRNLNLIGNLIKENPNDMILGSLIRNIKFSDR